MPDTALIVMARYPEPGKTKTRLARSLGDVPVATLYTAFLSDLAQRFTPLDSCALSWAYTPVESDFPTFAATLTPSTPSMNGKATCFPQQGVDLGARLHHAFQWAQQQGFQRTIVISSDSPQISAETVTAAREQLEHADVVLGPAEDGGYYLLAMRAPHDVFTGIPMSTSVVLQMTIAAAERQKLRVHLLETLFDVDELADLQRLARLLIQDQTLAPTTANQITKLRDILL